MSITVSAAALHRFLHVESTLLFSRP
ncbi:protein of unknown function (plasmid) [Caballeronia sp. S22]